MCINVLSIYEFFVFNFLRVWLGIRSVKCGRGAWDAFKRYGFRAQRILGITEVNMLLFRHCNQLIQFSLIKKKKQTENFS